MISLAIPTFNRTDFVIESFSKVINNSIIDEIIIVDDCSDINKFNELKHLIDNVDNYKIKLYRNEYNLKPFFNKYETVKKCNNEWIILLDSDNIIDNDYIDIVSNMELKEDYMYIPEILITLNNGGKGWNYEEFNSLVIDKNNAKNYIDNLNFETCLNTGNFFVNRKTYIENIENNDLDINLSVADAIYFSYLWILHNNKIVVPPKLQYIHRIHIGSYYMNTSDYSFKTTLIRQKIKEL